jgi:CheY-like chemotaxis protein
VYKLLADAPSSVLIDLLARGLTEKRTALVLPMTQVLGDRADRDAATPPAGPGGKSSLLVRALSYPDHAVQFAAASALLRSPVAVPAAARPLVVDILRRAASIDAGVPADSKGTVLLADPVKLRSDMNAQLLRSLGFTVEQYITGRDVIRRMAHASDFDLIFIDHHTANPELIDLIAQLQSDPRAAARPIYVIASSERPRSPSFDQLLVRTSALIAATENDVVQMPAPYVPTESIANPGEEQAKLRQAVQLRRDNVYRSAAAARITRLKRVIDSLPLTLTESQKRLLDLRVQLIQYAFLDAEFPSTRDSAPDTAAEWNRIRKQIAIQPPSPLYGRGIATADLIKLIERFELDVAKSKGAQEKYDFLRFSVDAGDLGLSVETFRDSALEARLMRTLREYPAVKVIPEPYSRLAVDTELKTLFADPMMVPRDGAAKKADAKAAIEYLKQMAVGDLPGYDLKSTEVDIRTLLTSSLDPEVVAAAIDTVERFRSGEAQQALLRVALRDVRNRPLAQRMKAADAVIRHIRANGKAITPDLVTLVVNQADSTNPEGEPDAELRGKFLTLKGMLAYRSAEFVDQLKGYRPPVLPPKKEAEPKKDPEPEPKKDP